VTGNTTDTIGLTSTGAATSRECGVSSGSAPSRPRRGQHHRERRDFSTTGLLTTSSARARPGGRQHSRQLQRHEHDERDISLTNAAPADGDGDHRDGRGITVNNTGNLTTSGGVVVTRRQRHQPDGDNRTLTLGAAVTGNTRTRSV